MINDDTPGRCATLRAAGSLLLGLSLGCLSPEAPAPAPKVSETQAARQDALPVPLPLAPGFADLHNHQFGEYAYQGAWYHGSTLGPEGGDDDWEGMSACSGNRFGGERDHALSYANLLCAAGSLATEDVCWHGDTTRGYTGGAQSYADWPKHNTLAHQQSWWGHLRDAWEDGLTLTVVPGVNFRILCEIMEPTNYRFFYDCEDLGAVDLQMAAAWDFVSLHNDWVEIATSPAEARRIIAAGKLAMVLAIEVTDIFPTGEMDHAPMELSGDGEILSRGGVFTQLERYHALGVRSIQLAHEFDSRFAGVAVYSPVFEILGAISDFKNRHPGELAHVELPGTKEDGYGFDLDENGYNTLGLTQEGEALVSAMMDLGMPVDISHLSHRSVRDIYAIAKARQYHPLFHSHAKLRTMMIRSPEDDLEKWTPDWLVDMMRVTGGMVGLRTLSEPTATYPLSAVANNCDGSTRSFAQAYEYGAGELDIPLAYAVDFNGFATQMGPRFGAEACNKAPPEDLAAQQLAQEYPTGALYDTSGLAHMGLLGRGLTADMERLGVDTGTLFESTEGFIEMWERAEASGPRGPAAPPPVTEASEIGRRSVDDAGLTVVSIRTGPSATAGEYRFRVVPGTGGDAVVTLRRGSQTLAEASFDPADTVRPEDWATFDLSPYVILKVSAAPGTNPSLGELEQSFFNGQMALTLAYP